MNNAETKLTNLEAERAVLGSVLIHPDHFSAIRSHLGAQDFTLQRHRWIWEAITSLDSKLTPIDMLTLPQELEQAGHLAEVGGAAYLTSLITATPSSLHSHAYVRMVAEYAARRRLLEAARQIAKLAMQTGTPVEIVLKDAEKTLDRQAGNGSQRNSLEGRDLLETLYARASNRQENQTIPNRSTSLETILNGFQPGDLALIVGLPGASTRRFFLKVAWFAARSLQKRVLFCTQQQTTDQVISQLLCLASGIDLLQLRMGAMSAEEWRKIAAAVEMLRSLPIQWDDSPVLTPARISDLCRRGSEAGWDFLLIDGLPPSSGTTYAPEYTRLDLPRRLRQLKDIARETCTPILVAIDLDRSSPWLVNPGDAQAADLLLRLHPPQNEVHPICIDLVEDLWEPSTGIKQFVSAQPAQMESDALIAAHPGGDR